jgi:Domain of unknown function DUF29
MPAKMPLYEEDFYAWSQEQAALLRAGKAAEADLENIAEEIESMGKSEKRELISRLTVLFLHLVKWRFQPMMRGRSWRLRMKGQRLDIRALLDQNPSLKPIFSQSIEQAWPRALIEAERETGLEASNFQRLARGRPKLSWTTTSCPNESAHGVARLRLRAPPASPGARLSRLRLEKSYVTQRPPLGSGQPAQFREAESSRIPGVAVAFGVGACGALSKPCEVMGVG